MRLRTLASACLAAAAVVTTTALPASAAPTGTPTLPDGLDGTTVSGVHTVTATSDAAYVRFEARTGDGQLLADQVPVTDGQASWNWPTWGFGTGVEVLARDCDTDAADSCAAEAAQATVDVSNPVTDSGLPQTDLLLDPDVDAPLQVDVTDDQGGGTLQATWDDQAHPLSQRVVAGTATPYDFTGITHGSGVMRIVRCSTENPAICAAASPDSATVEVRTRLLPDLGRMTPTLLSPNGDGRQDTATVTLHTEDITTAATWTVLDARGNRVDGAKDVDVTGLVPGGDTDLTVDPAALGVVLPDGDYTLQVTTTGTDRGHDFTGTATTPFQVDTTPDTVTSLTADRSTFYPYRDDYQDTVAFTPVMPAAYAPGQAEVVDAAGKPVRVWAPQTVVDGKPLAWDGRDAAGRMLAEGTYRMRLTMTDTAGNTSERTSAPVTLSHKRLVHKTITITRTAKATGLDNYSGRCSTVMVPGKHGWTGSLGYFSQYRCKGTTRDMSRIAAVMHGVQLPKALSYGRVSLRAYGGASRARTGDVAGMFWQKPNGDLAGRVSTLGTRVAWHAGGSPLASTVMDRNRWVLWNVFTNGGMRYDVAKFTVSVPVTVLQ